MSDFEIEIGGSRSDGYQITARSDTEGDAVADHVRFPLDEPALERAVDALKESLPRSRSTDRRTVTARELPIQELGQALLDFLRPPALCEHWASATGAAAARGERLRIRLRIGPSELLTLPWELLYDAAHDDYIAITHAVVRTLDVPRPQVALAVAPPLRILAMAAQPTGYDDLDIGHEQEVLDAALAPLVAAGRVTLTWVRDRSGKNLGQTWNDLQNSLDETSYHVLHFVGHGGFAEGTGEGMIVLADERGRARDLSATDLATMLTREGHSMRLVVLNSCEGARGSADDRFSSTASVLLRRGIPAVVAMQYAITDRAATAFAEGMYTALAAQYPIEIAVTRARFAVKQAAPGSAQWITPVIYLRSREGDLFDIADVASTRSPATEVPAPTPAPAAPWWRTAAMAGGVAVAAVAIALVVVLGVRGTGPSVPAAPVDPAPTPAPTSAPTSASTSAPAVPALLSDDFSTAGLDPRTWMLPVPSPANTRQQDGHLLLTVRPGSEADYAKLDPRPLTATTFTSIAFTLTVPKYDVAGTGGAYLVINGYGRQPHRLVMGPSSGGGVRIEPELCDDPPCDAYAYPGYTRPAAVLKPTVFGEAVPVEIARKDGHLVFSAKGTEIGRTRDDPGPLDSFWFATTSGGDDSWDVQIDDLVVR